MYMHAAYVRLLDLMAPKEDGKLGAIITPEAWCWRMLETPHLVWPRHLATVPEQSREGNSRAKDLGCPPLCSMYATFTIQRMTVSYQPLKQKLTLAYQMDGF